MINEFDGAPNNRHVEVISENGQLIQVIFHVYVLFIENSKENLEKVISDYLSNTSHDTIVWRRRIHETTPNKWSARLVAFLKHKS